ncbi:MAG: NAD(+)/NADH kinase [Planctomycetaceae bacterium]
MPTPLRMLILARGDSPRVTHARTALTETLAQRRDIRIVDVLTTDDGDDDPPDSEFAIVIGGDGAILRACRSFGTRQRPILGVNVGRLGFLADLATDEVCHSIDRIAAREFHVTRHLMFVCEHTRADGSSETHLGLNEAAIMSAGSLSMIDVHLEIDRQPVTTFSGDGLIISTPVGSTAHSLSAGGPILRQDLQAFVVTPICPHALSMRSLVDSADVEYRMTSPSAPPGVMLVIDGQIKVPFAATDAATVKRAHVELQLARMPGHSFYNTLHRKLGWAGQPKYSR